MPPVIPGRLLNLWRFNDTNFMTARGFAPVEASGIELVAGVVTNAVHIAGPDTVVLRYNVVEANGRTNIDCTKGTARFWFKSDFDSGFGSGGFSRLLEIGAPTTNASFGWWSLYFDPFATNLTFAAQSNGVSASYFTAPISIAAGDWHQVCLTWSESNSVIYLDGAALAAGSGVSLIPDVDAQQATGLLIGSDTLGGSAAFGTFDELQIYNYPLEAAQIAHDYETSWGLWFGAVSWNNSASSQGAFTLGDSEFDMLGAYADYSSADLWLEIAPASSTNATIILHNTLSGTNYTLLARSDVAIGAWGVVTNITGAAGTNCTSVLVDTTPLPMRFFWVGEDLDSDGVMDWKDADPRDAAVGILTVTIDTPANGSSF